MDAAGFATDTSGDPIEDGVDIVSCIPPAPARPAGPNRRVTLHITVERDCPYDVTEKLTRLCASAGVTHLVWQIATESPRAGLAELWREPSLVMEMVRHGVCVTSYRQVVSRLSGTDAPRINPPRGSAAAWTYRPWRRIRPGRAPRRIRLALVDWRGQPVSGHCWFSRVCITFNDTSCENLQRLRTALTDSMMDGTPGGVSLVVARGVPFEWFLETARVCYDACVTDLTYEVE